VAERLGPPAAPEAAERAATGEREVAAGTPQEAPEPAAAVERLVAQEALAVAARAAPDGPVEEGGSRRWEQAAVAAAAAAAGRAQQAAAARVATEAAAPWAEEV